MKRKWLLAIGGIFLGLICACAGIGYWSYLANYTYTVTYRAEGAGQAQVNYQRDRDLFGTAMVEETVTLPWELSARQDWYFHRRAALLHVEGTPGSAVTCEVQINGISAERLSGTGQITCGYDEERNPVP